MNNSKLITRQSQIKIAIDLLNQKNIDFNLLELVVLTESLTDYISEGLTQNTTKRIREVGKWMEEKKQWWILDPF